MIVKTLLGLGRISRRNWRRLVKIKLLVVVILLAILAAGKTYQTWDDDPDRGAVAINNGAFGENYATPKYLAQGWSESDSLWFYNTTQGLSLIHI